MPSLQVIHALQQAFNQITLKQLYSLGLATTLSTLSCRRRCGGGSCFRCWRFGCTTTLRRRRWRRMLFSRLAASGLSSTRFCRLHLQLDGRWLGASAGVGQALDHLVLVLQRGVQFLAESACSSFSSSSSIMLSLRRARALKVSD